MTETSVDETRPWGGVADRRTGNWAARGPGAESEHVAGFQIMCSKQEILSIKTSWHLGTVRKKS